MTDLSSSRTYWLRHGVKPDVENESPSENLPTLWVRNWKDRGRGSLIRSLGSGESISAATFEDRSAGYAEVLASYGAGSGVTVLLSNIPSISAILWLVAVLRCGATVAPLNPTYRASEVAHVAQDAGARVVVAPTDSIVAHYALEHGLIHIDPSYPDAIHSSSRRRPRSAPRLDGAAPDDVALLLYTSGTTGRSKGVGITHRNLLASMEGFTAAWGWTADDDLLLALPIFHMHGLGVGLNGAFGSGGSITLAERFDESGLSDEVASGRPSMFFGVPTMYHRLASRRSFEEFSRLRLMVSGSAPLAPELFDAIESSTGQRVLERYGMTETVMLASNPLRGERRRGSVGFDLPGVSIRVGGDGVEGELEVQGANIFAGYLNRPDANEEAFTPDGYFRTGDVGRRDGDGYLHIVGRTKELIISGGYNVYPREVEDVITELAGVEEAGVVGRPSDEWGESVEAFVVASSGVTVAEILAHCRAHLAPYKVPKSINFVDELPRNALGKLLRAEIGR